MVCLLIVPAVLALTRPAAAQWTGPIDRTVWEIPADKGSHRWLIIRGTPQSSQDNLYHIEVLERKAGQPAWSFHRVAEHLALTETALRADIVRPLKRGDVYPETYDNAYAAWLKLDSASRRPVCTSRLSDCLDSR